MILHVLIAMVAGWLQRHQQQVITYLVEENRVLKAPQRGRLSCHARYSQALVQAPERRAV